MNIDEIKKNIDEIKEIRIYFECLEQANHYVKPAIEKVLKDLYNDYIPNIKLIKLTKKYELYSTRLKRILELKDPDILVSLITTTNIELPLFMIEFSTAVFTEDHELQRFDALFASAENDVVFIKISPTSKTSEAEHGGKKDFDYRIQFALIYKKYNIVPFHINWKSDGSIVKVHENFLSCPRETSNFEKVLKIIFMSINITNGIDKLKLKENTKKLYQEWLDELEKVSINNISNKINTSRLQQLNQNTIEIKINRFGHAMDPERGMLIFYSTLFNGNVVSKMIFDKENNAWYKGIPKKKEAEIHKIIQNSQLKKAEDFLKIFYLGSGLYNIISFDDFKTYIDKNNVENNVENNNDIIKLNLSNFIERFWDKLNKPLKTIFKFSKQFYIEDKDGHKRVIFEWRENITPNKQENTKHITPIQKITEIDEDIVTYVTIHNVLRPQGYKILAASYPGAQGDRVVLIAAGTGRGQPRKYIDVIAFSLKRNISTLQSNKGKYSQSNINKEIKELKNYKFNQEYRNGLKYFFKRFKPNAITSTIKIGVGFWLNRIYKSDTLKNLKIENLDYFLFITKDMKKWYVGIIGNNINLLNNYEGKVSIPDIYEPSIL